MSRFSAALKWMLVPLGAYCGGVAAEIIVDGVLDEAEWRQAQVFTEFVVTEPMTGDASPHATEARLYSDDDGIYIGFTNYQPPEVPRIQRRFARDEFIQADRNIVGIDFDGTGLSGYDFTVGIANSQSDATYRGEKDYSGDWDGTWYSQTSQNEDYWYVEIFIPWTVAPMSDPGTDRKTMKIYLGRFVWAESIRLAYPFAATSRPTFLSDWQPVEVNYAKTQTLDWFPYVTATHDRENDDNELKAGVDVVWRPNSATQFTGTINPDFGQVESDELEVNFSAFETFFSEKRPFFTENNALFNSRVPIGDRLVHTRRIGAAPDVGDEELTDIIAGAKVSHYGDSFDLAMFAVSEDDTGDADGRDFLSTRVQGHVDKLSFGHALTYADRPSLDRKAVVNSLDWDWQDAGARIRGQGFYSDVQQDANIANNNLDRDDKDWAGWGEVEYRPDDEHLWQSLIYYYGDEFDMNDMGFLKRNDWMRVVGLYQRDYTSHPDSKALRSSYWRIKLAEEENNAGDVLQGAVELTYLWKMETTQEYSLQANIEVVDPWDDRITRGNGIVKLDPQHAFKATYLNSRGGDFNYTLAYEAANRGTDKPGHEFIFNPSWYVHDRVTLSSELSYSWIEEWLLWDSDTSQLATYEADVYDMNLRLDWYPDTRQEIRVKLQWIAAQADALAGQGIGADGRITPSGSPVDDFSVSDTAIQIRYRYQLAPLSDIFLVYERGGFWDENDNEASNGKLFRNAWDDVTRQRVLAKIRYRF
ncbi:MAG: hypothetical protein ACI9JM_001451 [Halioglobus sp.]|jgi:hypothetical protein